MYLSILEMQTVMYAYQLEEISEGNDIIVTTAINTAIEEVKSYLTGNQMKEWNDGRKQYDVAAIFAATGTARNELILTLTKTCAEWHILQLSNVDIIYDKIKDRYDRAIAYLKQLAKGQITIAGLPELVPPTVDGDGNAIVQYPFRMGGRQKFNHE
jgi:hypothetical protein